MWMIGWRAISARIGALLEVGAFFFRTNNNDDYGSAGILIENARSTVRAIYRFQEAHGAHLPDSPKACLDAFVIHWNERFGGVDENNWSGTPVGFAGVTGVVTALASFRADFEYLIADTEYVARSLVIRAFAHLQRSIVADDLVGKRWQTVFSEGEVACERLGACHLLAHGIWAFKTSTTGERTDLVMGEPLEVTDEVRRASQGLVLTEWKCVRSAAELEQKAAEAYHQAKRYSEGILFGFEVVSPRYLILISEDHLCMPSAKQESGGAVYEYRNIAANPKNPSQHAREVAGRSEK